MKYKLRGDNNIFSPIEQILYNRKISDIDSFLNAGSDPNSEHHFSKLKNIDKAVNCLLPYLKGSNKKSKIFIQIDPDVDGYTSSASLIGYLKKANPEIDIEWRHQLGKEHGIESSNVPDDIDLVIVPDAGSSDFEEHKKLSERKIEVLIIDHHEIEGNKESEYAIVVNNQLGSYPNRYLSGAGVVYKVLQALDAELGVSYANDFLDLVAIGIISDMMPLTSFENQYYITQGLKQINNPLILEMIKLNKYLDINEIIPKDISFSIAPKFNAVIRAGAMNEKEQLFKALLSNEDGLIKNTAELVEDIKQKQDELVENSVEQINEIIVHGGLLNNKVLTVDVTGVLERNFTGLVANKLLNQKEVKRPVLLLHYKKEENILSGSARGYDKGFIKDLQQFLLATDYFESCKGHSNAFGCVIKKDRLQKFHDFINNKYRDIEFGSTSYDVDFVLTGKNVKSDLVSEIDSYKYLWGQGIEEPLVAIQNLKIERRNIRLLGKNKDTVKFAYKGIEYIKFRVEQEELDNLTKGDSSELLSIDIIGRTSINEWRGYRTPQFIIEDFEIVEIEDSVIVF